MVSEQEHDLSLNDPLGGFPVYNIVYLCDQPDHSKVHNRNLFPGLDALT